MFALLKSSLCVFRTSRRGVKKVGFLLLNGHLYVLFSVFVTHLSLLIIK